MGLKYQKGSDKQTVRNEMVILGNVLLSSMEHSNKCKLELQTYIEEMLDDGALSEKELEQLSAHDKDLKKIEIEVGVQLEKLE